MGFKGKVLGTEVIGAGDGDFAGVMLLVIHFDFVWSRGRISFDLVYVLTLLLMLVEGRYPDGGLLN